MPNKKLYSPEAWARSLAAERKRKRAIRAVSREKDHSYYARVKDSPVHKKKAVAATRKWRNEFRERDPKGYAKFRRREQARYKARDPFMFRVRDMVSRANVRGRGRISVTDVLALYKRQQNKCYDCGRSDVPLSLGHGIPLFYKHGRNEPDNLLLQCKSCNSKQHLSIHPDFGEAV